MTVPLFDGESELDRVSLVIAETGEEIKSWTDYTYKQSFTNPLDEWSFTMDGDGVLSLTEKLTPGLRVKIKVNNLVQCTGYIEAVDARADRNGGTSLQIRGSTILFPVVVGTINPKFKFTEGMTVGVVLQSVLEDFGIDNIEGSNDLNINAMTGANRSGSKKKHLALTLKDVAPQDGEGCFQFLDRLLKRMGLAIWAKADGSGVVVDKPDFTSPGLFNVTHLRGGTGSTNNILSGSASYNFAKQPTVIVAKAKSTGGADSSTVFRSVKVNELTGLDASGNPLPSIKEILDAEKKRGATEAPINKQLLAHRTIFSATPIARPYFVTDCQSKTQEQIDNFVKREMAKHQHEALTATYEFEGHSQKGFVFAINTLINVSDDVHSIHAPLWVSERQFRKSKGAGTTTNLTCILPFTLDL